MNEKDKLMLQTLLTDKGKRYQVIIDNDCVWVEDKENEGKVIHDFQEYSYTLLQQVLVEIGLDAEFC